MKKMNRIYLLLMLIFLLVSCDQKNTINEKDAPLDPELYAHPDSIIVHDSLIKQNSSLIIVKSNNLPIHGFKESGDNGETIYHTIPDWEFVNQNGEIVSSEKYKGQIYIAEFFFTNCPTICPKMTVNMHSLQEKTKELDVQFLSYTVDPIRDTSATLKTYQQAYGINEKNWNMLTGDQYKIYELGVKGYLVPNQEDALAPGGFLHSEMFMLIDQKGRIRGYYDGTNSQNIDKIVRDIKYLNQEK